MKGDNLEREGERKLLQQRPKERTVILQGGTEINTEKRCVAE